jgi:flagellar biogenesis protein FliO
LPSDVVEVLGRAALGHHQHVQLVRCGAKLLLLSIAPSGTETLTEITDPDEVSRLVGLCRQSQPGSASLAFRQVFQQFVSPSRSEDRDV